MVTFALPKLYSSTLKYHNGFEKSGRFIALQEKGSFTLNILHAEPSDSATYFCAVAYYTDITLADCTVVVSEVNEGGPANQYAVFQNPVSDPVQLGSNATLQCSVLTENSVGEHSMYWFRHGSGDSHPGLIYTHRNRSDRCEESSETGSPTQSCIYKLPKRNLSPSDAGTYYCAVAACGEIIFGNGTKQRFLQLLSSQSSYSAENHTVQAEDTGDLNYAALSFAHPPSSRKSRAKNNSDQPVYGQAKICQ
ncbi:uncharacterized protein [Salminus brasiliensis]|uniref:uncharacterized protein n=1 Tax=Salminus brasiliensis TaxID=930266 RepID=UPI003B83918D